METSSRSILFSACWCSAIKYNSIFVPVQAIQLTDISISYEKWGGIQQAKKGDWLLSKNGEQYTCEETIFAKTYKPLEDQEGFV